MSTASPAAPLVSVVLAAHDAGPYLALAVDSVLRQSLPDFELIVVDDCSSVLVADELGHIADPRLRVVRNNAQVGLAGSLNRALDLAAGQWIARLDADDAMLPRRLETQLAHVRTAPAAIVGSGVLEIDDAGRPGRLHEPPLGRLAVRWQALFGAPFFHPTVLVDRTVLERHGLRYDTEYLESEDYDLWSRLLAVADGDNVAEPLVLRRLHPGQASRRRTDLQRDLQRRVALREIAALAPGLTPEEHELAWLAGAGLTIAPDDRTAAGAALAALLERFEEVNGRSSPARLAAARSLARIGGAQRALELDPLFPARVLTGRMRRRRRARGARSLATGVLRAAARGTPAVRVAVVSPEPTPYRSPLFDRIAARDDVDLTVIYAGRTVAGRTWTVEPEHEAVYLKGVSLPGAARVLNHEYPVTPGIWPALGRIGPDVAIVSGWSTFAAQATLLWCRLRRVPYVLLVVSHDAAARSGWRSGVRRAVVPRIVRRAAGVLVVGSLARAAVLARGARSDQVAVFANTIDVEVFAAQVAGLRTRRPELRAALGLAEADVAVLTVARLAPEKRHDVLIRAVAAANDPSLALVLAGTGPERGTLAELASSFGVRVSFAGDVAWDRIGELYAAADVFALLSDRETWGVVVNEAAAAGLPLVLSDQVGAAADLLRDGENGTLVPAGDVGAAAAALSRLAADPAARAAAGERSRELVSGWGYEPSVEAFVKTARDAALR